jgi:hypothetical protein
VAESEGIKHAMKKSVGCIVSEFPETGELTSKIASQGIIIQNHDLID